MGWIRDLFAASRSDPGSGAEAGTPPGPRDLAVATAVLLLEVQRADHEVDEAERDETLRCMRRAFGLTDAETREVLETAAREVDEAVSVYGFTRLVDRNLARERKVFVVELLFRVAFADSRLAGEEEHLIRKVATLLHVEHPDFIAARSRARAASTAPETPNPER